MTAAPSPTPRLRPAAATVLLAGLLLGAIPETGRGQGPAVTTAMVAMSDGVKLATDVYLPGDGIGKYPVIVARTPYNKAGGRGIGTLCNARGYACVVQDEIGRAHV